MEILTGSIDNALDLDSTKASGSTGPGLDEGIRFYQRHQRQGAETVDEDESDLESTVIQATIAALSPEGIDMTSTPLFFFHQSLPGDEFGTAANGPAAPMS